MAKLEQWSVVLGEVDPYQPPECITQHLHGQVYGREGFVDGDHVTTSAIAGVLIEVDKTFVTTKTGNAYELGEVDPSYEAAFPNALERLRASVVPKPKASNNVLRGQLRATERYLDGAAQTLEYAILATPTSETRNSLTDINISVMMMKEKVKILLKEAQNG